MCVLHIYVFKSLWLYVQLKKSALNLDSGYMGPNLGLAAK